MTKTKKETARVEIGFIDISSFAHACTDNAAIAKEWALLSDAEKQKARNYHFAIDRNRFILGRAAIRRLVAQRLLVNPKYLELTENEFGKPMLKDAKLHFNVSHSGDLIALALSSDQPIGIDIEHVRPIPDHESLVNRTLDPDEKRQYFAAPRELRNNLFLNAFSQKEACLKSIGIGLSLPMNRVHTSRLAVARSHAMVDRMSRLQIYPLKLPKNYVGVLAGEREMDVAYISQRAYSYEGSSKFG